MSHKRIENLLVSRWGEPVALLVVCGLIVIGYSQTLGHQFFWDSNHIFKHETLRAFTLDNITWVFFNTVNANWHPVTLLTHIIDFSLFGWNAGGHHLINVALHCMTTIAVFYCIKQLLNRTDHHEKLTVFSLAILTSVFFALHPLRVESVAWVAARKDLLYSLFFVLSIVAYVRYVDAHRWSYYVLSLSLFVMALLSKSMAVTLPAVLLLLDYYPLRRLKLAGESGKWVLADKIPYLLLTLGVIAITLATQSIAIADERLSQLDQIKNAIHNIVFYLDRFVAPIGLVPFYPFPEPETFHSMMYWLPQLMFVLLVSAASLYLAAQGKPLLLLSWGLYLVMLSPVSGVIHVGSAVAADRYTYLTLVPFCFLTSFAIVVFWHSFEALRQVTIFVVFLMVLTLTGLTFMQAGHWHSPLTLWSHVLRLYPNAALAHRNISTSYQVMGLHTEAIAHLRLLALQRWPVAGLLAEAYVKAGRVAEGIELCESLLASHELGDVQRQTYEEVLVLLRD